MFFMARTTEPMLPALLGLDQHDMNSFQDFFHFFLVFSAKSLKL